MLRMRSPADILAEYGRAASRLAGEPSPRERVVMTAVRDALAWVLGYTDEAPWTQRVMPSPGAQALWSEWSAAETVNHNAALMRDDPDRFTYGSAVEHALAWARGTDTAAPAGGWG